MLDWCMGSRQIVESSSISVLFFSGTDFLDVKLGERLSVAGLSPVVLLAVHLEDGQLGPLEVFHDLSLDHCLLQVWFSHIEFAVLLDCKDSAELDGLSGLSLLAVISNQYSITALASCEMG